MKLETVDSTNFKEFLSAPVAFLMVGKTDCPACIKWTEELVSYLDTTPDLPGVRFGKVVLDGGGVTEFKRTHAGWLKDVMELPYNTLWVNGQKVKDWTGNNVERLANRLNPLLPAAGQNETGT